MHSRTRTTILGLVLIAVAAAGIACTDTTDTPPTEESAEDTTAVDDGVQQRRAGRAPGSLTLGDLNKPPTPDDVGAPFDPCGLAWTDFPAAVRPTDGKPHKPTPQAPGKNDPYELYCRYDNSGTLTVSSDGTTSGATGRFIVSVVWGRKLSTDPAKHPGATQKTWSGKPGLIDRQKTDKNGTACTGYIRLSAGVAATSVTNSAFPDVDPCTVADAIMTAVAAKTG